MYNVTSDDGYVTQLVRIVNKHVAGQQRKHQIPVVLYAGQGTSPGAFLVSAINKVSLAKLGMPAGKTEAKRPDWLDADRSLAFALSKSGYDVSETNCSMKDCSSLGLQTID